MYKRNKYIKILADITIDSKIKHVIGLHAFIPTAHCYCLIVTNKRYNRLEFMF